MPELPEVETIKNGLSKKVLNKTVDNFVFSNKKLRLPTDYSMAEKLKNANLIKITRRAKIIIIDFSNSYSLLFHLGMTGKILFDLSKLPEHLHKHNHLKINFDDGSYLIFNDIRRFGFVDFVKTQNISDLKYIKILGPEPLSKEFNLQYLQEKLKNKSVAIKKVLMDNSIIVGVGNIYACESLFKAKINPNKKSNLLNKAELSLLVDSIKHVLEQAINQGGTTLQDYVHADGSLGYFQNELFVYGQNNKPCKICNSKIQKITIAQRSTFFCPKCQK